VNCTDVFFTKIKSSLNHKSLSWVATAGRYLSFRKWRSSNDAFHLVDGNYTGQYTSVQLRRLGCGNWGGGMWIGGWVVIGLHFESTVIQSPLPFHPLSLSLSLSLSLYIYIYLFTPSSLFTPSLSLSLSRSRKQLNFAVLAISLATLQDTRTTSFTRSFDFYDAALARQNHRVEFNEVG